MKYKVGDRVRIKSLDWYNENKDEYGVVDINDDFAFYANRSKYCGKVFTISKVFDNSYFVKEDNGDYYWIDEMIEGLVEEESANYSKVIDNGVSNPIIAKTSSATIDTDKGFYSYSDSDGNLETEWNLPNGYIFKDENGNVINATKIVLEKKKKEYPTTLEECCEILGLEFNPFYTGVKRQVNYKDGLLHNLKCLLIYRDAYWKLYGEEMGLGKPWEPDWKKQDKKYIISVFENTVIYFENETFNCNTILAFPTEEMRDAFYKNFKSEIESCKELL